MLWLLAILALGPIRRDDSPRLPPLPPPFVASTAPAPSLELATDPAAHVDGGLDLDEILRLACQGNPTLPQAAARFEQARGRAIQAGAYPNPLIIWSASSLGDEGTAGNQQAFIQQPITTGGKIRLQRARYEVEVELARWAYVMQELRIRNGAHLRYLQILAQQRLLDLRDELIGLSEEVVRANESKVESGHADEADLLMARNEAELLRLDREQAFDRYRNSWRELAAYLGRPDLPPARLEGTLEGPPRAIEWGPALDRLLAESPEVRSAELRIRREALALDRERAEPIPDLVVRAGAGHDPAGDQTTGYARIYLDLPIWDRNRGNIHAARHGLIESRLDLDRVRLGLRQRLARDLNHHQTSLSNVRRYREVILPRARRAFDLYLEDFRDEDASSSRVQAARAAYVEARIKYVRELLEMRSAEVAIDGLQVYDETIESGTLRPPGAEGLQPPGEGLINQPAGGGVPVGRP